ncbi:MAG TPA: ChbG/HpnK family deacetylase [Humidesulfovibrio sp.]|uniref:ChbG/HpnK family deacetylase n=1 Tax=Humidesulfovibrio sp. TaxID=2910988 RepID=UPI002C90584E|nr:ChbG/HpnK family deacetylase [Humidesulfovibrio sp.]HWR02683.1 ChbG/HpnK family deacetylase [Humidesulfovibrio sp.]
MAAMFVVVNVDDLGLHPAVRRAVEDLAGLSRVSSSTLLVNGPDAAAAARLSSTSRGSIGVGVHLNILRGRPESPAHEIPGLTRADGLFLGDYVALFKRYLAHAFTPTDVEREWTRQVERALEMGVTPTHLDSEKHIHVWPGLFEAASRVAKRFGIGWVRRPVERVAFTRWDKGALRARILNTFALLHRLPGAMGVAHPACVFGIADQGASLLPERLAAYMKRVRPDVLEVVCHPGAPLPGDPPLPPEYGPMRIAGQWTDERDALAAKGWGAAFKEAGAQLVHYGQLDPATRTLRN